MGRPDTIVWQECESPGANAPGLAFQIVPAINPPSFAGFPSPAGVLFRNKRWSNKLLFAVSCLAHIHHFWWGDNEEAVSGAAAVGLKGNTDGKRARGGNGWVEINWEDLTKSG